MNIKAPCWSFCIIFFLIRNMPCDNKPCTGDGQFTNAKDGKQFCSPECAKAFYKSNSVRVSEGRSQEVKQSDFVEVSKRHPAFAIMNAKEKEAFLSFGREEAVGLGAVRQDAYRVHKAIKMALDMIGAGEDEEDRKRKAEDGEDSRKKQDSEEAGPSWSGVMMAPDSFLEILPVDLQLVTLRLIMLKELDMGEKIVPAYRQVLPDEFLKTPLFLDMFERNFSMMPNLFKIERDTAENTFKSSHYAYKAFSTTVQFIVWQEKGQRSASSRKLMRLVSDSWKVVAELNKAYPAGVMVIRERKSGNSWVYTEGMARDEIVLNYAEFMNVPSTSSGILKVLRDSAVMALTRYEVTSEGFAFGSYRYRVYGRGYTEYVANLVYLAGWLLEDWKNGDETFNPMVDGYLFIELVRQFAHEDEHPSVALYGNPLIKEAFDIFLQKLFYFEPTGKWTKEGTKAFPFNPFRVAPELFKSDYPYAGADERQILFKAAYRDKDPKKAFEQLRFAVDHISKYSPELRLRCFQRFPGQQPKSGRKEQMPKDDAWKKVALDALYEHIQGTDTPNTYLCALMEARLGQALWDNELEWSSLKKETIRDPILGTKFVKLKKQEVRRVCNYRDQKGNVPTFKMSDLATAEMFGDFLDDIKQTVFRLMPGETELERVDKLSTPATRPASVECYRKNMSAYVQTKGSDPFFQYVVPTSYIFTLYNYVNGLVPAVVREPHRINLMNSWVGLKVRPDLGQHRLILYTAPDRKSQTVLYLFGKNQKVDWEKHPNLQLVHSDILKSVKVTIKNADGSLTVYNSGFGTLAIPPNNEHLLEGSEIAFLSTYFPAEDEPVFKINDIPVYKEWGQPRLPPPPVPEAAGPVDMEQ